MLRIRPEVLVIAHDAGCAEVVAAYVDAHRTEYVFYVYAAGPAVQIFKRYKITTRPIRDTVTHISGVVKKNAQVAFVLLGTGWMTSIDSRACVEAKKLGIKTVVYLDSWGDYRTRFGYPKKDWKKNLPDELWVGDKEALKLARTFLPGIPVKLVPNEYAKKALARFRAGRTKKRSSGILFLSRRGGESSALLGALCTRLALLSKPPVLYIRLHPAENSRRYDALIKRFKTRINIIQSRNGDIVRDFILADTVIGTETTAMALSAAAGIRTICLLGPGVKPVVPTQGIKHVYNTVEALKLI